MTQFRVVLEWTGEDTPEGGMTHQGLAKMLHEELTKMNEGNDPAPFPGIRVWTELRPEPPKDRELPEDLMTRALSGPFRQAADP
jgi:hypothetical protein